MRQLLIPAALLLAAFQPVSETPEQPERWTEKGYPRWTDSQMEPPALPPAPDGATEVDVNINGYVLGLKMIDADYSGWVSPASQGAGSYALRSDLKTAGLGALLQKLRIWAVTSGAWDSRGLHPRYHLQQNRDKKRRRVDMRYGSGDVAVSVIPPNGSQGVPPASPSERFGADDTISALLHVMLRRQWSESGAPCEGTIPVFDSKQHYNLRLVNRGQEAFRRDGYRGPVTRCDIYYEPVSGFDPEDLPDAEEGATPIKAWLAPVEGVGRTWDVPIRFSYKISGFKAVMKIDDLRMRFPDGRILEMD